MSSLAGALDPVVEPKYKIKDEYLSHANGDVAMDETETNEEGTDDLFGNDEEKDEAP